MARGSSRAAQRITHYIPNSDRRSVLADSGSQAVWAIARTPSILLRRGIQSSSRRPSITLTVVQISATDRVCARRGGVRARRYGAGGRSQSSRFIRLDGLPDLLYTCEEHVPPYSARAALGSTSDKMLSRSHSHQSSCHPPMHLPSPLPPSVHLPDPLLVGDIRLETYPCSWPIPSRGNPRLAPVSFVLSTHRSDFDAAVPIGPHSLIDRPAFSRPPARAR